MKKSFTRASIAMYHAVMSTVLGLHSDQISDRGALSVPQIADMRASGKSAIVRGRPEVRRRARVFSSRFNVHRNSSTSRPCVRRIAPRRRQFGLLQSFGTAIPARAEERP